MIDRLTNSRHFGTFAGFFFASLGVVSAVCFVVGVAVVIDRIAGVMN